MSYQYTYLIMDSIGLVIWTILFVLRKDVRKEMLFMSLGFGAVALLMEPIYLKDWWRPLTITNTPVGIEDFLSGFVIGGICAVIYEVILRKRVSIRKSNPQVVIKREISFLSLTIIFAVLFFIGFFALRLNSFYSSFVTFIFGITVIFILRRDLIFNSLISGFLVVLISFATYSIMDLITPGWVREFWYFRNTPDIIILSVPIDDLFWNFLAGAFIGPLYEFWKGGKVKPFLK
ncbi:MAG: lycopene cyclase domain-containing protein [bacterium]|nr:lycopene cyclase domain-containing protein [bacterium]